MTISPETAEVINNMEILKGTLIKSAQFFIENKETIMDKVTDVEKRNEVIHYLDTIEKIKKTLDSIDLGVYIHLDPTRANIWLDDITSLITITSKALPVAITLIRNITGFEMLPTQ